MDEDKRIDEDKLTEGQCETPEVCIVEKKKGISEDWLALWLGLFYLCAFSRGLRRC